MRRTLSTCLALGLITILYSCTGKSVSQGEERRFEANGMELAMRQEFLMTRDLSLGTVPKERLDIARAKLQAIAQASRMQALGWEERGPNNIGGRTRAIIVDSRDASGNTVLAASVSGGIFRTTNFTAATPLWTVVNDKLVNLAVTAMKQDPTSPNVMYAGTGEGWFNVDAVKGAGIYKSTDGGVTWNRLPSTATFEYVQDIDVDTRGNVYAALRNQYTGNRGVVRSTDGGTSWTQVLGATVTNHPTGRAADLEVAANGDVYATLGIFSKSAVLRSSFALHGANTGARGTWDEITPVYSKKTQRAELAIAPSNSQRLYLLLQDSASSEVDFVFRSNNAGATWDSLPAPVVLNNGENSQTWYNLIAAVDPSNPDVIVVGGLHLARSIDGGANWTTISTSSSVHVDQHELVYLTSSRLYVGNDGGVYYSDNMNAGTNPTFRHRNNTYNVTQFYAADFHPTNANYFLAGAQDNNTQRFNAPGINTTSPVVGGDGGFPHIDQTDGVIQIAATINNNYYRSTNNGQSFSQLSSVNNFEGQFINPTDYDDVQNILYCGHAKGKYYVISNMHTTPTAMEVSLPDIGEREVTAVKWDHHGTNTIWLGATLNGNVPMLVKVGDANTATPKVLTKFELNLPDNAYISSIDVDPGDWRHVLVTLSNYGITSVFESKDGGVNWTSIEGNLPDMPVRWGMFVHNTASVNGTTGGGILLGTELGVWYASQTSGATTTWVPQNESLPNVRVDMLKYRPSDRLLLAATHGRGLYTTQLAAINTGVPSIPDTKEFIRYTSNGSQELLIKVGNLSTTKMQVSIFDMNGRLVSTADTRYTDQRIDTRRLSRGSYVLKISGNKGERYTRQFVK
ncbi:MAG TPA: T9SS type A sorting domain-containing protein [Chitinophagaceae bacterium]